MILNNKQKRIALINDITGFGRCSIAVQQPIISALQVQACAFPTAILSTHTKFPNYKLYDFTENMESYMENWQENNISFDGICSGFLGSKEQVAHVLSFFKRFKTKNTLVVVDPVMGDNGKLYHSYTKEMCKEMKKLIPYADVITPNLTEACILTNKDYQAFKITKNNLKNLCYELSQIGPQKIVITGIEKDTKIINCIYEKHSIKIIKTKKIGEYRTGTGDIFVAIVAASLINKKTFSKSVKKAIYFINKALRYTKKLNIPLNEGVCFEKVLKKI